MPRATRKGSIALARIKLENPLKIKKAQFIFMSPALEKIGKTSKIK